MSFIDKILMVDECEENDMEYPVNISQLKPGIYVDGVKLEFKKDQIKEYENGKQLANLFTSKDPNVKNVFNNAFTTLFDVGKLTGYTFKLNEQEVNVIIDDKSRLDLDLNNKTVKEFLGNGDSNTNISPYSLCFDNNGSSNLQPTLIIINSEASIGSFYGQSIIKNTGCVINSIRNSIIKNNVPGTNGTRIYDYLILGTVSISYILDTYLRETNNIHIDNSIITELDLRHYIGSGNLTITHSELFKVTIRTFGNGLTIRNVKLSGGTLNLKASSIGGSKAIFQNIDISDGDTEKTTIKLENVLDYGSINIGNIKLLLWRYTESNCSWVSGIHQLSLKIRLVTFKNRSPSLWGEDKDLIKINEGMTVEELTELVSDRYKNIIHQNQTVEDSDRTLSLLDESVINSLVKFVKDRMELLKYKRSIDLINQ